SAAQRLFYLGQMMPAVPDRMIFNNELCGHRCVVAETERCRRVELLIGQRTNGSSRFATVLTQELKRFRFTDGCFFLLMIGVEVGNRFPGHLADGFAAADGFRKVHLDGIDACDVVNDYADRATVVATGRSR